MACCFSCKFCGSHAGKARNHELTTDECISVANQLAELGCERVSLIGGEVFLRPDWNEIAGTMTSKGIRVSIITNGFLFEENLIQRLKNAKIESMAVSLDSVEPIHDKYRQKGSFQRACKAIDELSESGIPVSVISTLNAESFRHIDEFYEWLKPKKIFAWQIQACSPMGNASNGVDYHFNHYKVIQFVADHMSDAPFVLGVADNIGYYTEEEGYIRGNTSGYAFYRGCRAGLSAIGIDSVGNVRGCESMYDDRFNEGNLRERSLRDIWEDPDAFTYNRGFQKVLLTGKCSRCGFADHCAGGCRSYNFFTHGRPYEAKFCAKKEDGAEF